MAKKGPSQKDKVKTEAKSSGKGAAAAPPPARTPRVDFPEALDQLHKAEADKRQQELAAKLKGKDAGGGKPGGPVAKPLSVDELKKFVRGEITLAQLEGISREQLYDFAELGYNMFKTGKLEDAMKIFEGLVTYNPYDAYFHSALGAIYQKQRRFDDAIRQYDLALKFNSRDTCALTNRGETLLLLGRLEEAADNFNQSIALDADEKDPWSMRARALIQAVNNALKKDK